VQYTKEKTMRPFHSFILVPLVALAACGSSSHAASEDAGPAGSRNFPLAGFDKVSLRGSDDVKVVPGETFSVIARGPEKVLDLLEIEVDGDTLKVGRKSRSSWAWSHDKGATITVTMPAIRAASVAGSGDMSVDQAVGPEFKASVAGSGNLRVAKVEAESVEANVAGSGDLEIAGTAKTIDASGAGSGNLSAKNLIAETAKVSIAGSGNATIHAATSASVSLVGSGDVDVSGTDKCSVSKIGSGEVRCTI
jgi:hypothetical protein